MMINFIKRLFSKNNRPINISPLSCMPIPAKNWVPFGPLVAYEVESSTLFYKEAISKLKYMYEEKRSDVAEQCDLILEGKMPDLGLVEHRFVRWEYLGREYLYDTLTNLVEFQNPSTKEWEAIENIEYID